MWAFILGVGFSLCRPIGGSTLERLLGISNSTGMLTVIQRCRTREFEPRCCRKKADLSQLAGCFGFASLKGVAYARHHCCNDEQGHWNFQQVSRATMAAVECLWHCPCPRGPDQEFDCACARKYLQSLTSLSSLDSDWRSRVTNLSASWPEGHVRDNTGSWTVPMDCYQNTRHALRLLEHMLLLHKDPVAVELHANMSQWLASKRAGAAQKKLRHLSSFKATGPGALAPATAAESEVTHIAMVASIGVPVHGWQALATIRSALVHAAMKLHFHLFTDRAGQEDMESALRDRLEEKLKQRIAEVTYYGEEEFPRIQHIIRRRVPKECLAGKHANEGYGAPGWMRIFPHEVLQTLEHVIWADAGDYIFFADPAMLLAEHLNKTALGYVATYPANNSLPLQIFSLRQMEAARWSEIAEALLRREFQDEISFDRTTLCFFGEGTTMQLLSEQHSDLFAPIQAEWALEPREPFYSAVLMRENLHGGYTSHPQVWQDRVYSGLVDPLQAFVFCPNFVDWFTHFFMNWLHPPVFAIEIAQLLMIMHMHMERTVKANFVYEEPPVFGGRQYQCGAKVLGMHMIRNFRMFIPWSVKLLVFWRLTEVGPEDNRARKLPSWV